MYARRPNPIRNINSLGFNLEERLIGLNLNDNQRSYQHTSSTPQFNFRNNNNTISQAQQSRTAMLVKNLINK